MWGSSDRMLKRGTDLPFQQYIYQIVHDWSKTLASLGFILVPLFFILDYFTMPLNLLPRFAAYRLIGTVVPLILYFIIRRTKPGKTSYVHGYLISFFVGGVIAMMTVDLGGFDSRYYAGINLVIIAVNLMLPWEAIHSAINGIMLVVIYVLLNLIDYHDFYPPNLINNLFFMNSTVIIAVSINYVRNRLIRQEFHLRAELRKARDALWGEMELAKKIQTSILPANDRLGVYQIAAIMKPADEVGGDYYDFFEADTGERWFTIGDVSGHGVDSGLIMMMTQTSVISILNSTPGLKPSKLLGTINAIIRKNIQRLKVERYMTIFAGCLNAESITIAGKHMDIIILRGADAGTEVMPTEGTWIGIADNIEDFLVDYTIPMSREDLILLYTDGATEAKNSDGDLYGISRLSESLIRHRMLPVKDIIMRMLEEIELYQKEQDDDISLLVIKKIF